MIQTALVLQGGGALGVYEFGALQRLFQEPDFKPSIISGVSIGAITAATLAGARGEPIKTLQTMWERLATKSSPLVPESAQQFLSLFGNPCFFRMRMDYINWATWTSFYDTAPLRCLLEELLDFERLNSSEVRLFLTATNVATGQIEVFDNRRTRITPDHVLASGALPPGFPMIDIDHGTYWDGGLFDNSPLSPVIEAMDPSLPKQIIVMNLFPGAGPIPQNMMGVLDRAFEIVFSNKFRQVVSQTEKISQYVEVVEAIDKALPDDHPIRCLPGYRTLKQYTIVNDIIYIENRSPELVIAPFDFSQSSIKMRIDAGYRDTEAALATQPKRTLPAGMLRASN